MITAVWRHQITSEEMEAYTALSGDRNPIHLDDELARQHNFPSRLVYGMLIGLFLPRVFAMVLPPEPFVCLSQTFRFPKPVFVGDEVEVAIRVKHEAQGARVYLLDVTVMNQRSDTVVTGDARILVLGKDTDQTDG